MNDKDVEDVADAVLDVLKELQAKTDEAFKLRTALERVLSASSDIHMSAGTALQEIATVAREALR